MTRTVAVLGQGLCGWLTAAALARRLPRQHYRVIVIDDGCGGDGLGDFGPVIAVPPTMAAFHAGLGLDEDQLIAAAHGSFALGLAFSGWRADSAAAFLPFGAIGEPMGSVAFHQLAGRLRAAGKPVRLADYSLAALAAQTGRFARPSTDPASPLSRHAYGLHLEVAAYTATVRGAARASGATLASAPYRLARRAADGAIAGLELTDGSEVTAMLYLDCSGAAALLARGVLETPFADWAALLPCDTVEIAAHTVPTPPPPYAHVEANETGWVATWPLDGAEARLSCRQGGPGRRFANGALRQGWTRNCIAIGAAACVLEPLHPTALTLVRNAIARLVSLFPATGDAAVEAATFNAATANEQARARDFLAGQYSICDRPEPFWQARRADALPEPLARKRDLFAARGRIPMFDDEMFEEEDWAAMFDAGGLIPRRHDAMADLLPVDAIEAHMAAVRARIIAAVRTMPSHAQALAAVRQRMAA